MKPASLYADLIETVDFRLVESFPSCHADMNGQLFCHADLKPPGNLSVYGQLLSHTPGWLAADCFCPYRQAAGRHPQHRRSTLIGSGCRNFREVGMTDSLTSGIEATSFFLPVLQGEFFLLLFIVNVI